MTITCKRRSFADDKELKKITSSTLLILEAAEKLGVKWHKIPYTNTFELAHKGRVKYFYGQIPSETSAFAYYCCKNKRVAKHLLEKNGLSVSKGFLIKKTDSKDYQLKIYKSLEKPLIVKPVAASQGDNVFLNIKSQKAYFSALEKTFAFYGEQEVDLLVEQMFFGQEYRILLSRDKVLSIIKRLPPNVIGDGKSTIKELIECKNANPLREKLGTYKKIRMGRKLKANLAEQDLELNSVLNAEQKIILYQYSGHDVSLGGDTVDITDEVHPSVKEIALKAINSVQGLSLAGIDFLTKDAYRRQTKKDYRIIELNASPSLDWNQYPLVGKERPIAEEFLKIMFEC